MVGKLDLMGGRVTLINETNGAATTYYGDPFPVEGSVSGDILLVVEALFGSTGKSLQVTLEHSNDLVNWETLATYTAATGAVTENEAISGMYAYMRAKCELDGTETFAVLTLKGATRAA